MEVEIELKDKQKKRRAKDPFAWLFGGTETFERYSPVKTKIDADIERIFNLGSMGQTGMEGSSQIELDTTNIDKDMEQILKGI